MDTFDRVLPAYGGGSLAEVLPGVLSALGVPDVPDPLRLGEALAGVRRVAVLLVDGLGHLQLPLAAPVAPALATLAAGRLGQARSVTAAFPSTTPVSLATLGTGAPPGAHGLVGFTVRVPGTHRVLNHIQWDSDPDPQRWQPLPTRFAAATRAGVATTVVSRPEFAGSGLTVSAYHGADYRPAADPEELAAGMLSALVTATAPALVYGYHPDLDRAGHLFGVGSRRWRRAAAAVDRLVTRLLEGMPGDAALVVTSDHGQIDVPPRHRYDLDTDPRLAGGVEVVAGEPRVRYLHTTPGAAEDVIAAWREVLRGAALVVSREQAVAEGWFGPVTPAHRDRIGDVVVACQDRFAVLATAHESETVAGLVAYHGSFTAAEMLAPLLVARPGG